MKSRALPRLALSSPFRKFRDGSWVDGPPGWAVLAVALLGVHLQLAARLPMTDWEAAARALGRMPMAGADLLELRLIALAVQGLTMGLAADLAWRIGRTRLGVALALLWCGLMPLTAVLGGLAVPAVLAAAPAMICLWALVMFRSSGGVLTLTLAAVALVVTQMLTQSGVILLGPLLLALLSEPTRRWVPHPLPWMALGMIPAVCVMTGLPTPAATHPVFSAGLAWLALTPCLIWLGLRGMARAANPASPPMAQSALLVLAAALPLWLLIGADPFVSLWMAPLAIAMAAALAATPSGPVDRWMAVLATPLGGLGSLALILPLLLPGAALPPGLPAMVQETRSAAGLGAGLDRALETQNVTWIATLDPALTGHLAGSTGNRPTIIMVDHPRRAARIDCAQTGLALLRRNQAISLGAAFRVIYGPRPLPGTRFLIAEVSQPRDRRHCRAG